MIIPAGKVLSKAGCDSGKGSTLHVAAQEIWNELVGERLKGSRVPSARCARTCYFAETIEEARLLAVESGEVKNRDVAKAPLWKTNQKRAEESRSFVKCVKIWCAKVPRGHVCPRCVIRKARSGG
jgi:hypothetical protein